MKLVLVPIERDGQLSSPLALPAEALEVLPATVALYDSVGFESPWIGYIAAQGSTAVGACGFKSAPQDGRVEIAYFTFPRFEGQGVATEMAARLIEIAVQNSPGTIIAAQTLMERNASHRILEKHGFTQVGEAIDPDEGPVLEWQRTSAV